MFQPFKSQAHELFCRMQENPLAALTLLWATHSALPDPLVSGKRLVAPSQETYPPISALWTSPLTQLIFLKILT